MNRSTPTTLIGSATADLLIDMAEAMGLAEQPIAKLIDPMAARGFLTVLAGQHVRQELVDDLDRSRRAPGR